MLVSFSIGVSSPRVIASLKGLVDNIDFSTYASIQDLINEAELRKLVFDRIIFSIKVLDKANPEKDLSDLFKFIRDCSEQTEVVYISTPKDARDQEIASIFDRIFNSQKYTSVFLTQATSKTILDMTTESIATLKTKYGRGEGTGEKERKGFLGSVFGGSSKKNVKNSIPTEPKPDTSETDSVSTGELRESNQESSYGNQSGSSRSIMGGVGSTSPVENSVKPLGVVGGSAPVVGGEPNLSGGISGSGDMEMDLSIGDLGMAHSDTGYFSEEDEEELRQLSDMSSGPTGESTNGSSNAQEMPKHEGTNKVEEQQPQQSIFEEYEKFSSSVVLVISDGGSKSAQAFVDNVCRVRDALDRDVLIVDMDMQSNRVLSFINTERFYNSGSAEGISKLRVYTEDLVGVASEGYGEVVSSRVLSRFLSSKSIGKYSKIFIDCPVGSLKYLPEEIITKCDISIICGNDRADLMKMSLDLTNRELLSYKSESYICENGVVNFIGGLSVRDLEYVKSICLFAGKSWLDRV